MMKRSAIALSIAMRWHRLPRRRAPKNWPTIFLRVNAVPHVAYADAIHIAIAALQGVQFIASWNFRHIVNLDRIRGFNAVNLRMGYSMLEIRSPLEVWKDENEDV